MSGALSAFNLISDSQWTTAKTTPFIEYNLLQITQLSYLKGSEIIWKPAELKKKYIIAVITQALRIAFYKIRIYFDKLASVNRCVLLYRQWYHKQFLLFIREIAQMIRFRSDFGRKSIVSLTQIIDISIHKLKCRYWIIMNVSANIVNMMLLFNISSQNG